MNMSRQAAQHTLHPQVNIVANQHEVGFIYAASNKGKDKPKIPEAR